MNLSFSESQGILVVLSFSFSPSPLSTASRRASGLWWVEMEVTFGYVDGQDPLPSSMAGEVDPEVAAPHCLPQRHTRCGTSLA